MTKKKDLLPKWYREATKLNKPGNHSIYVMPQAAKVWERHGWTAVDDGSSETDSQEEPVDQQVDGPETGDENEENY